MKKQQLRDHAFRLPINPDRSLNVQNELRYYNFIVQVHIPIKV